MRASRRDAKLAAAFIAVAIFCSALGAAYVNATSLSSPSVVWSQYECDKGTNFYISVDNAVPPNFYATSGENTLTQNCGTLSFGGPNSNGGAVGTNATQVIQAALNALPTGTSIGGGVIAFETGNYTVRTLAIPPSDHSSYIFTGKGDLNTLITYLGSNTKPILWEPWTSAKYSISHLSVEIDNLDFNVKSSSYTGNALDLTIVPEVSMLHVLVQGQGAAGDAGSIGLKHDVFGGDGNPKELTDVHISGFSTDMQWMDDHAVFMGDYFNNYLKVGVRFGNNSGFTVVDNTMISPHIQNDNALLTTKTGIGIQFNFTSATHGIQITIITPYFESPTLMQCAYDFRAVGGSTVEVFNGQDATVSPVPYQRTCLGIVKDMSKVQFHLFAAPGVFGFPYFNTCKVFGVDSSLITGTSCAASNNPTSGIVYQDWMVPNYITISGGTGVNITINTAANVNIASLKNLATIGVGQPFLLPVGFKLIVTFVTTPATTDFAIAN